MQRSVSILGIAAIAAAFAFATPASAKSRQRAHAAPQSQYSQVAAATVAQNNPTCVYSYGQLIGCDPDPNIRQRLGQYNGYAAVK